MKTQLTNLMFSFMALTIVGCGSQKGGGSNTQLSQVGRAIVGTTDWQGVNGMSYDRDIYRNAQAVGYISIPSIENRCTAFLVSEDLVMTNWHCFTSRTMAKGARFYPFFNEGNNRDDYLSTDSFSCDELLVSHKALDVAVLRCSGKPGRKLGVVALEENSNPRLGSSIYVLHQNCDYHYDRDCAPSKKYSPGKVVSANSRVPAATRALDLFYDADTLGGSSGSPVFSGRTHKVVALHHNGHGKSFSGRGRGTMNSGVPMPRILEYLGTYHSELGLGSQKSDSTTTGKTHRDFLSSGDIKFYKMDIKFKKSIRIELKLNHHRGDLDLYLLTDTKEQLAKSEGTTNLELIEGQLEAGSYLVAVAGYKGASGEFQLTLE